MQGDIRHFFRLYFSYVLDGMGNAESPITDYRISDWHLLCATGKPWFKSMWSDQEYNSIKALKRGINSILKNKGNQIIPEKLSKQIREFSQNIKPKNRKV